MSTGPGDGDDPTTFTDMNAATIAMHEMYVTLQQSGFTKDEALSLISSMLSSVVEKAISGKKFGA